MFRTAVALMVLGFATTAGAVGVESAPYVPFPADRSAARVATGFVGPGSRPTVVELPAASLDLDSDLPGVPKTGTVYTLPQAVTARGLLWERSDGYYTARIRFIAAQAARLRVHVIYATAAPEAEFRVQGADDAAPAQPVSSKDLAGGAGWLPVAEGRSLDLEIAVAAERPPLRLGFRIDAVNLIAGGGRRGDLEGFRAAATGAARFPEQDLVCWSGSGNFTALRQAAAATAEVEFIVGAASYLCSGTLLNDKGHTNTPWFVTANHCIPNQTVADTATFKWLYQATECGGRTTDPGFSRTSGGATLLRTEFRQEFSFLKLKKPPGAGTVLSGWDTDIAVQDVVWGVHHPEGDHTMVSRGQVTALEQEILDSSQGNRVHVVDEVKYSVGGTESGSSGSGLFSTTASAAAWKGSLFGGDENDYQLSSYSHFAGYYEQVKKWLESCRLPWGGTVRGGARVTAYSVRSSIDCAADSEVRTCAGGVLDGSFPFKTCEKACVLPWGAVLLSGHSAIAYRSDDGADCTAVRQRRSCRKGVLSGSFTLPACSGQCPSGWDPAAPMADAGQEGSGNVGDRLRLNGSLSCNGNPPGPKVARRFAWSLVSAPANANGTAARFRLRGRSRPLPSFVPPLPGDYRFQLVVGNSRTVSAPAATVVHVGGAITVDTPFAGTEWLVGQQPLEVAWSFSGISSRKRFNLFLVTDEGSASSQTVPLKRRLRSSDAASGHFAADFSSNPRRGRMLTEAAVFRVCLPPVGGNDPVCGQSGRFAVR